MQFNAAGQVVPKLETRWRDRPTHQVMSPLEFTEWLAALIQQAVSALANDRLAAAKPLPRPAALGRGRVFVSSISLPQTSRASPVAQRLGAGAFYRRLCDRIDKPRAHTATAHKLARMVYFTLTRNKAFVDKGQQRCEEQQRERSIAALKRRAAALGLQHQPRGGERLNATVFTSIS